MKRRRILLVEGGCVTELKMKEHLESLGYQVIPLVDCSDTALGAAAEEQPELILLDAQLFSEGKGLAMAEQASGKLKIPLVLIAGLVSEGPEKATTQGKKLAALMRAFVLRPLDDPEIGAAIESAVYRHRIQASKSLIARSLPALGKTPREAGKTRRDPAAALEFMKQVTPFSQLPEKGLSELVKRSYFSNFAADEYLTFEGEQNEVSFVVLSGRLAMTKTSVDGRDLIVQLLGPRDFFGLVLAMEEFPEQLSARAQTEAEVLWIPTAAVLSLLDSYPGLYKAFVEQLSSWMHASHNLSRALAHDSVDVRIAAVLLHLASKFARSDRGLDKANESSIVLDITRQQIADLTGATPETVSRVTRSMHRKGICDTDAPGVIRLLKLDALKKLVTGETGRE